MAAAGGSRRRHSLDVPSSSRPLFRHHFSSNTNLSASANNGQGMQPLKEQDEVLVVSLSLYTASCPFTPSLSLSLFIQSPLDFLSVMKNSKSEEMLIYACGKLAQALDDGKTLISDTYMLLQENVFSCHFNGIFVY